MCILAHGATLASTILPKHASEAILGMCLAYLWLQVMALKTITDHMLGQMFDTIRVFNQ